MLDCFIYWINVLPVLYSTIYQAWILWNIKLEGTEWVIKIAIVYFLCDMYVIIAIIVFYEATEMNKMIMNTLINFLCVFRVI